MCDTFFTRVMVLSILSFRARADCPQNAPQSENFRVCVTMSIGVPVLNQDYRITFQDPNPPIIELITGDHEWTIFVQNTLDDSPGDLAALLIDPSTPKENYGVRIADDLDGPGVRNVGTIDLTNPNWTGASWLSFDTSLISGDLDGDLTVTDQLHLIVGGNVSSTSTITAGYIGEFYAGYPAGIFAGRLEVLGNYASIVIGTLTGIINYNGNSLYGDITLIRGGSGQIINGGVLQASTTVMLTGSSGYTFSGTATFGGAAHSSVLPPYIRCPRLTGVLHITGDMDGVIEGSTNGFASSARIEIDGDLGGAVRLTGAGTAEGTIRIGGDVLSIVDDQSIEIAGTLGGAARISICGSLSSLYMSDAICIEAIVHNAALTVDYDGDDFYDYWGEAGIRIGSTLYTYNSPHARLWDVTSCRGDMNNDGAVNNFDIDPFILALSDPAAYVDEFPGLEGSMIYHGDCDCSGMFNNFDIDTFIALVSSACCTADCQPCDSFGHGNGRLNAGQVASILAENVANERFESLLSIVADISDSQNSSDTEFWGAVLEILGG